jgi:transketolase
MRIAFADAVLSLCNHDDAFFLTGDLGFMALESVRDAFGDRFFNAGVAEQNMIGVAAGLAREGYRVIAYSIAPFCYARPFEQIRNDLCFGRLSVCLVGNGGGYGYGHMGPTHHALEDCAAMAALGVRVLVPAFDEDLSAMITDWSEPTYLRLGYDARPKGTLAPAYAPWRLLLPGEQGAFAALGPMAGVAWQALQEFSVERRPALWAVSELGGVVPEQFYKQAAGRLLIVAEEHVAAGGLGMHIALAMQQRCLVADRFLHRYACGYPSGRYGSQSFHRGECGLDMESLKCMVREAV